MRAAFAASGVRSSSAPMATISGIQVLPIWAMSGTDSPTYAVSSFSCAAVQGICCTVTLMPGFCRSNSGIMSATTSPSRPRPQNSMCVPVDLARLHERSVRKARRKMLNVEC